MKNQFINLLIVSVFILSLSSCTVTHRNFMPGYQVEWKKDKVLREKDASNLASTFQVAMPALEFHEKNFVAENINEEVLSANIYHRILLYDHESELSEMRPTFIASEDDSCDVLILKTGKELPVIIVENNQTIIRYKSCGVSGGPLITIDKADVFLIKYANGTKEVVPISESTNSIDTVKTSPDQILPASSTIRKTEPVGMMGIAVGLLGLIAFQIPLGILAIICGIFNIIVFVNYPKDYSSSISGVISILLGVADIILALILIS